ncbi:Histone acetyltransferase [Mycena sanguinolenta]|uniref:Endopeptidase S2P n=1 Tax=Mycena sanguinolenta TaxID=230812 RepID=A0A8H6ZIV5_9AGAR|nr:Histone acetyltransferase [Mycena sanguinolenta]
MSLVLVVLLLWTVIHAANYFLHRRQTQSILPPPRGAHSFGRRRNYFWDSRTTQVILNKFHLRVQTSAWNAHHDSLSKVVAARPGARFRSVVTYFYNLGSVVCVLGSVAVLGLTLAPSPSVPLLRRGMDVVEKTVAPRDTGIKPIIPGWTVPLNHLPVILLAVFLSQIVHELGHAFAAALDAVPIMSAGVSFTVVVPAAFVSFPATALEALKPLARSRIIAAGPFHNLVFWSLLVLVDRARTGDFLAHTMYHEVSDIGRVVVGMDGDSALQGHLALGSLITKLDDTSLASPEDRWTSYLTSPHLPTPTLGWCVDRAAYLSSPQSCCEPHVSSPLSCFSAVSSAEKGCLDAVNVLVDVQEQRCGSDADCSDASQCVRPDESAPILRLTIRSEGQDRVILWSGPLAEVYEQVETGTFLPRFRFLPLWAYTSTRLFWSYLKMATLSLYLFNLLPLPYLDGSQFVEALLDMAFQVESGFDEYDVEALEAASTANRDTQRRNRGRWKEPIRNGISIATMCLFVLSALLALTNIR